MSGSFLTLFTVPSLLPESEETYKCSYTLHKDIRMGSTLKPGNFFFQLRPSEGQTTYFVLRR